MLEKYKVLLVEDDQIIAKSLKMSLNYKGFDLQVCESLRAGFDTFQSTAFDLVLLDINLPDGSGLDLCRQLRTLNQDIPILMVTAKTDEQSAILGLEGGADDYIRKPYGTQELVLRMLRLLEQKKVKLAPNQFGSLRIDSQKRLAWTNETQLNLGKREFEILNLLVKRSGEAVTRSEILNALGETVEIYDRTIDSHLSHLRRKLKNAGALDVQILPIYGIGYRLDKK